MGDSGVGKTNLRLHLIGEQQLGSQIRLTRSIATTTSYVKKVTLNNGHEISLQIYDTDGDVHYRSFLSSYFLLSKAVLLLDVSCVSSINSVCNNWIEHIYWC